MSRWVEVQKVVLVSTWGIVDGTTTLTSKSLAPFGVPNFFIQYYGEKINTKAIGIN